MNEILHLNNKNKKPWRLTEVDFGKAPLNVQSEDGTNAVANGFKMRMGFLNREPSLVVVAKTQPGLKNIQFGIPLGITAAELTEMLRSLAQQIDHYLVPETHGKTEKEGQEKGQQEG